MRYPTWKRLTAGTFALLLSGWLLYVLLWPNTSTTAGDGVSLGKPAPEFELKTVDGEVVKLSDYKGKPVMLNFFATWCPPCKAEMPLLVETYKQYQAEGYVILAIDMDESDVAISSFREKYGITFPIVVDKGGGVSQQYQIVPLPTSYFVDRDGIVQGKWTGEIRKPNLDDMLKRIL